MSKSELARAIGQTSISGKLNQRIREMLTAELIEYTIPEKPNSRLQKYRLTDKGQAALRHAQTEAGT
jgi:ATP-dependent DNA helicase RecG